VQQTSAPFAALCALGEERVAKPRRLTQAVILKRLDETWDEVLASCFGLTQAEAKRHVRQSLTSSDDSDSDSVQGQSRLLMAALDLALGKNGRDAFRKQARSIKTEEDLARAIQRIRDSAEVIPSATRKAMKMISAMMPRRGGPGRQPKLGANDAGRACDQIALFVRQGNAVKVALQKTADLSPTLLGKKVSARTLQKAWKNRDKLTSQ